LTTKARNDIINISNEREVFKMKNFTIYYSGCAEYVADSEEEAIRMFESDRFGGYATNVDEVEEEEMEEDD
jgi:hypothetical protein